MEQQVNQYPWAPTDVTHIPDMVNKIIDQHYDYGIVPEARLKIAVCMMHLSRVDVREDRELQKVENKTALHRFYNRASDACPLEASVQEAQENEWAAWIESENAEPVTTDQVTGE